MTFTLDALRFEARDPAALAGFWEQLLGARQADDPVAEAALEPADDTGFRLLFHASTQPKVEKNQAHFDLTSAAPAMQQETVDRALALGARHIDIGQGAEETQVVLADPEGNEFCVIEAGNAFLAECGFLGAVACDGSQALGYFWQQVLDWPLVRDQDEETAIRSPLGGPKVTWGGPPVPPKLGQRRLRLHLAADGSLDEAVDRLIELGARRTDDAEPDGWVGFVDPDGNEFSLAGRQ